MSLLSSLGAISVPPPTPASTSVAQQALLNAQQTSAPAPASSTSYTPTLVSATDPLTYVITPIAPIASSTAPNAPIWQNSPTDAVSQIMAGDFSAGTLAGRFAGLGAALLTNLGTGAGNYSQSVVLPPPAGGQAAEGIGLTPLPSDLISGDITLDITTASGTKVELSIVSEGKLSVNVTINGSLSSAAQTALGNLAKGFQAAIDGYTAATPSIDLGALIQLDPTTFSSVNLGMQLTTATGGAIALSYQSSSTARSLSATTMDGTVNINVNLATPAIIGTAAQQATALSNDVQQFTQEESRDQGEDATLMQMFADGFTQINSNYPPAAPQGFTNAPTVKTDQDHAMLTGLADFQASVTQTPSSPNPLKPGEVDQFSYQMSQQTTIKGDDYADRQITQQQQSSLTASYHKPLQPGIPLTLTTDPKSQNYYYEQINDSAGATATIGYTHNKLTQASIGKSASQSTHETKFVMNQKVEDTTTVSDTTEFADLMAILLPFQKGLPQDAAEWKKVLAEINSQVYLQSDPSQLQGIVIAD